MGANLSTEPAEYARGTIRNWQSGDFIKFDDTPKTNNWMPVSVSKETKDLSKEFDKVCAQIITFKEPVDGSKYLDHIIQEELGFNQHQKFKKYFGKFGRALYSFENVMTMEEMEDKMELKRQQKGTSTGNSINDYDIKAYRKLKPQVDLILFNLKQGFDFIGNEKEVYDRRKNQIDDFTLNYKKVEEVREIRKEAIQEIGEVFKDNWAITETFKDLADEQFVRYKDKYKDRILKDSCDSQAKIFGVKIDSPMDEFYLKVLPKSIEENINCFELFQQRFSIVLNKELEGDWEVKDFPSLYTFEKLVNSLPEGHLLKNNNLRKISNHKYNGSNNYAFYSPNSNLISLSDSFLTNNPTFINSVLVHEVGHALSNKIRRHLLYEYREFTMLAGWDNRQVDLEATGNMEDIPRVGRNSFIPLITNYAGKSPEECFAEYYSFYYNNQEAIDKWINNKDVSAIEQEKITYQVPSQINKGKLIDKVGYAMKFHDKCVPISIIRQNYNLLKYFKESIFLHKKALK